MNTNNLGQHFGQTLTAANWREGVKHLRDIQAEWAKVGAYPDTPRYLLDQLNSEISNTRERMHRVIAQGAIGELQTAIDQYKKAGANVRQSVAREISRWDPTELLAQMGVYQARINQIVDAGHNPFEGGPTVADQLQALYQEARDSDNETHQRAAAEVFKAAASRVGQVDDQTKFMANHLQKTAQKDLQVLRETDDTRAAQAGLQDAWQNLVTVREELADAGAALGSDPRAVFAFGEIARAYRRVAIGEDGQPVIYEPDNPEVTGVQFVETVKNGMNVAE